MSKIYSIIDEVEFEFTVSLEASDEGPPVVAVRTANRSIGISLAEIEMALFVDDDSKDSEVRAKLAKGLRDASDRVLSSGQEIIY